MYSFFDSSPNTYLLHLELLNFMLIAMSTQLLCGPSPGPNDVNPFLDAAMTQVRRGNCNMKLGLMSYSILADSKFSVGVLLFLQDSSLVSSFVRRLLLNYITRPSIPFNRASYSIFNEGSQSSVLQRVGSAAGMVTKWNS